MFSLENGKECCFALKHGQHGHGAFHIDCENVDWNGTEFGWSSRRKVISGFHGTKPITQLLVFPLEFHRNKEQLKEKLIVRGKKFEELRGYHFKAYDDIGIRNPVRSGSRKFSVSTIIALCMAAVNIYTWKYSGQQPRHNRCSNL